MRIEGRGGGDDLVLCVLRSGAGEESARMGAFGSFKIVNEAEKLHMLHHRK